MLSIVFVLCEEKTLLDHEEECVQVHDIHLIDDFQKQLVVHQTQNRRHPNEARKKTLEDLFHSLFNR